MTFSFSLSYNICFPLKNSPPLYPPSLSLEPIPFLMPENTRNPSNSNPFYPPNIRVSQSPQIRVRAPKRISCRRTTSDMEYQVDCVGTGQDVECVMNSEAEELMKKDTSSFEVEGNGEMGFGSESSIVNGVLDTLLLISPFFFWGTAMVAMKEVLPKAGPFFVATVRLIPSGLLLIGFARFTGRKQPSGIWAWISIALFGLIDATCFQGFLAEGLQKTSAGLGSVIIDSQPLTVSILAALLFGETIGSVAAAGLLLGVIGLLLLEAPALSLQGDDSSLWGSGEWWMLLAAQSMAVGTVMVRWVSKYCDPVMATGWHMVLGGLPLLVISMLNHDPAISGSLKEFTLGDIGTLAYTSVFGSAVSYGVYFYNASRGSLTKLSSLTFLTPMFASLFGYLYLDERFTPLQLVGALVTVVAIYMVNFQPRKQAEDG
ncbi:hypothetical protein AMTRI_Chr09g31870 [Amborella trichopoda]